MTQNMTHLNEIMLYALVRTIMRTTAHRTNSNDVVETFAIKCFNSSSPWHLRLLAEKLSGRKLQYETNSGFYTRPNRTEPNIVHHIIHRMTARLEILWLCATTKASVCISKILLRTKTRSSGVYVILQWRFTSISLLLVVQMRSSKNEIPACYY